MPRETFERELQELKYQLLILGSMVEQAVREAVEALKRRDLEVARRIYDGDQNINEKRYEIEQNCLILIATQQPMARDLRMLAAILEVNTELERIGDYAKGICKINLMLGSEPLVKPLIDIPRMADLGLDMLHRALGAFVSGDADVARAIPEEDDKVDELYNRVYNDLLTMMFADPTIIHGANYLIWAAHNLERLADRVTNICERTVFLVTGEIIELDLAKGKKIEPDFADV
ncbi:MAG: phosphate signaling complex protein PhoU [Anaerolineales bacterium]|nr:phosphate signaling complex protein PhoU [Anaerolineales bacterium]